MGSQGSRSMVNHTMLQNRWIYSNRNKYSVTVALSESADSHFQCLVRNQGYDIPVISDSVRTGRFAFLMRPRSHDRSISAVKNICHVR